MNRLIHVHWNTKFIFCSSELTNFRWRGSPLLKFAVLFFLLSSSSKSSHLKRLILLLKPRSFYTDEWTMSIIAIKHSWWKLTAGLANFFGFSFQINVEVLHQFRILFILLVTLSPELVYFHVNRGLAVENVFFLISFINLSESSFQQVLCCIGISKVTKFNMFPHCIWMTQMDQVHSVRKRD